MKPECDRRFLSPHAPPSGSLLSVSLETISLNPNMQVRAVLDLRGRARCLLRLCNSSSPQSKIADSQEASGNERKQKAPEIARQKTIGHRKCHCLIAKCLYLNKASTIQLFTNKMSSEFRCNVWHRLHCQIKANEISLLCIEISGPFDAHYCNAIWLAIQNHVYFERHFNIVSR